MIRVVAALILREGKLLICQRRKDDSFPLKWEFPGGKINKGESPQQALQRELREELGVESTVGAEVYRIRHRYAEHSHEIDLRFFSVAVADAEVHNLAFERVTWEKAEALPSYDFLPADRGLIERLARGEVKLD